MTVIRKETYIIKLQTLHRVDVDYIIHSFLTHINEQLSRHQLTF